jgi:glycosyltransferase involved in cell wall biosynthesis
MRILIVEPYLAGSHAAWAEEYSERSTHEVSVLGLPGRHWKWRMHGGALTLARLFMEGSYRPDVVVATDMLDLSTFMALTRRRTSDLKVALYLHEDQLCYPWSWKDPDPARERDAHYGFINITSALAADVVVFNSGYHRTSFLEALGPFLRGFPDYNETGVIRDIEARSRVLHLGLDLARFDQHRPERERQGPALILWNHRWEYDKNPQDFFRALFVLKAEGLEFELAVLGEAYAEKPPVFEQAAADLRDRIVQLGYVEDFADYASWLWEADILPVTSNQDFFGASVVQAIHCDCFPLLPQRLAYPEHVPIGEGRFFYRDFQELLTLLRHGIENIEETRKVSARDMVGRYDWSVMGPKYDRFFESVLAREGS